MNVVLGTIRRVVIAGASLVIALSAQAEAPMAKTQAPGFHRTMPGDFEVTALFDGILELEPKQLLTRTTPAQVGQLLRRSFQGDKVPTSVNAYLINTGRQLVLIDSGAAQLFGPGLGLLIQKLKASAIGPSRSTWC